ncbi:MAG: tail fiber domain-containing protein [Bacteroidia bacterium]
MGNDKRVNLRYQVNIPLNGFRCSLDQTNLQTEWLECSIGCTIGKSVPVKHITITIPLGTDQSTNMGPANFLTFNYDSQNVFLVKQTNPGVFYITAADGKSTIQWNLQSLNIRITGIQMGTVPGVFKVKVEEYSASAGSNDYHTRTAWHWFGKYPYQFFMRNLVAGANSVNAGETVHLSWIGTQMGKYTMKWYDANGAQSADVTDVRSWQSPPLTQDTVFQLVGVANTPGALTQTLQTTVFVQNPALKASSLTTSGGPVNLNTDNSRVIAWENTTGSLIPLNPGVSFVNQGIVAEHTGRLTAVDVYFGDITGTGNFSLSTGIGVPESYQPKLQGIIFNPVPNSWNRIPITQQMDLVATHSYVFQFHKNGTISNYSMGSSINPIPGAMLLNYTQPGQNLWMALVISSTTQQGLTVTTDGLVGIANSTPAFALDVAGTVQATKVQETSDISLKQNVHPLTDALMQLLQLRGVSYDRRDTGKHEIGLIAQEVEQVLPELVEHDAQGLGSVAYTRLTAVLVEAVKAMKGEIEDLRAELRKLKGE